MLSLEDESIEAILVMRSAPKGVRTNHVTFLVLETD